MPYSLPASAKPFTLAIPDEDFAEWKQLLELSKIGLDTWQSRQDDPAYGISRQWLIDAKDYWLNKFDWRAQEKHINSFPNYKITVEEIDIHFIALLSEKEDAIPLLFLHGWPGSFTEFLPMLGLIRDKYSAKDLPYHVIVASLPGYTLSGGPPLDRSFDLSDIARVMDSFMKELGFSKYLAQGGDIGSLVENVMVLTYDSCVGVHLNMMILQTPEGIELNPLEQKAQEYANEWAVTGRGYSMEQATRPSTIGLVLSSSPLALLAWIGEKFIEWSDETPSLDHILTNITLYWFTKSYARSIYPYRGIMGLDRKDPPFITKPLGYSHFPKEIFNGIKAVVEKKGNLVFYKQHERGGHFAALERPKELLEDVEEFVKVAWKA